MARHLKEASGLKINVANRIGKDPLQSSKYSNILKDPSQHITNMEILMKSEVPGSGSSPKYRKPLSHQESMNVVIYRNLKYTGPVGRWRAHLKTYAQQVILQHLAPLMSGFHNHLLEAFGFLYLFLMTPVHVCLALVLFLLRQSRLFLVKKFYAEALVCEDLSPRCIFVGKSLGVVTCVLWLKGGVDLHRLRSYVHTISSTSSPILRKNLTDKFGIRVFVKPESPFDVNNHVVEAPKKYLKFFVSDETIHGGKSALEQFVTKCASENLSPDLPPWKITVIPQPVFRKEKTCVVLRFHYILLNHPQVEQLLENLFTQSIYEELETQSPDSQTELSSSAISCNDAYREEFSAAFSKRKQEIALEVEEQDGEVQFDFELPLRNVKLFVVNTSHLCRSWFQTNVYMTISDLKTWLNLQRKMIKFHSKTALFIYVTHEILVYFHTVFICLQKFPQSTFWAQFKLTLSQILLILRAVAYVPVEIFAILLHTYPRDGNGFKRSDKSGTRRVAWSSPVSAELLKAIRMQTGASTQSIVLTACSLALKDYYSETSLPNPKYLGVLAPIVTKELLAPTGYCCVNLQTDNISILEQLQKVDGKLKHNPPWKLLGHYYIFKYISYVLPRPLAYLVLRKMFKRYPITFTQINMQSPSSILFPHISLWGQTVDEFLYWRPPHSDFCVSISFINYSEIMRLSVLSPMKSLDTALTQRFCQNLNRIAEGVGVDKNLIPYSRKSSPVSSYCTSPAGFKKL